MDVFQAFQEILQFIRDGEFTVLIGLCVPNNFKMFRDVFSLFYSQLFLAYQDVIVMYVCPTQWRHLSAPETAYAVMRFGVFSALIVSGV